MPQLTAMITLRVARSAPMAVRSANKTRRSSSPFNRTSPFAKRKNDTTTDANLASSLQSSSSVRLKHWVQDYTLSVRSTDSILDCLLTIQRSIDPTLCFRYSCGHGICGSDAVNVNGVPTLICKALVSQYAQQPPSNGFRKTGNAVHDEHHDGERTPHIVDGSFGVIELAPLSGLPVVRDLICNIEPMLKQIQRVQPYLQHDGNSVIEYLQKPEELAKFAQLSNCIACGACQAICPVYAGGEAFMGPAALIQAARFIYDSRDDALNKRLETLETTDGVGACQSVRACTRPCPMGIDVGETIWQLITLVNEKHSSHS